MDNSKQQIVESIKSHGNILVAVSTNPTVDELSAALGLTVILNNIDKHATAVFSGDIPPAINFLEPDKTFENSADSLRDFIIALDKAKADHLRYKVEGDVVKIFITPYRTKLTQTDLEFGQGDYNVELVIALGVKDKDHLDKALEAHGKILHDATVVTITEGKETSSLGSIDWHDATASSLCEMVTSLAEGLKDPEVQSIFDQQIATALLTGIVSATSRFSNDRTSSRVMTMAAQLMASGANQQLIASKLEQGHDLKPTTSSAPKEEPSKEPEKESVPSNELIIDRSDDKKSAEVGPITEQPSLAEGAVSTETQDPVASLGTSVTPPLTPEQYPGGTGGAPSAPATQEDKDQDDLEKQLSGLSSQYAAPAIPSPADLISPASVVPDLQAATEPSVAPTVQQPQFTPPVDQSILPPLPPLPPPPPMQSSVVDNSMNFEQTGPVPSTGMMAEPQMPDLPPLAPPQIVKHEQGLVSSGQAISPDDSIGSPMPSIDDNVPQPSAPEQGGTSDGVAILASAATPDDISSPLPPQVEQSKAPFEVPELPNLSAPPATSPLPPPQPDIMAPVGAGELVHSGAVSGDVFGDGAQAPVAPNPGQFQIPGQ